MLIRLCEASRWRVSVGCSTPKPAGENAGQPNSVPSAKLDGRVGEIPKGSRPVGEKFTQACPFSRVRSALWVLWLMFGTRLRRWSHDRYMIFD